MIGVALFTTVRVVLIAVPEHLAPHSQPDLLVAGQPLVPVPPVVVRVVAPVVQLTPLIDRGREPRLVVVPTQCPEQAVASALGPLPLDRILEPSGRGRAVFRFPKPVVGGTPILFQWHQERRAGAFFFTIVSVHDDNIQLLI